MAGHQQPRDQAALRAARPGLVMGRGSGFAGPGGTAALATAGMGLGTALALAWSLTQPVTYTASAQLLVPAAAGGAEVAAQRVATHAALATSAEVLEAAAQSLNAGWGSASTLRTSGDDLARRVRAQPVPGAALLEISATGETAGQARDVAAAVAVQLMARTRALEPTTEAPAVLARAATVPTSPDGPGRAGEAVTGAAGGAVTGAAAGSALTLRRRRRRGRTVITRAEAAAAADVPVLVTLDLARPIRTTGGPSWFGERAEAMRRLRTAVRFVDHEVRTLVVTSPSGGEGRTGIAVDLALALADAGEDVVLLDADLRHPGVAARLGLDPSVGLTSVLLGTATVAEALQPWRPEVPLQVMTTGPTVSHPSELLGSTRMSDLLGSLREAGWTVVVDTPPLLPVTDAALLARLTDGALVAVRSGLTERTELGDAVAALTAVGAHVLGTVLTGAPVSGDGRYLRQVRHELDRSGVRHPAGEPTWFDAQRQAARQADPAPMDAVPMDAVPMDAVPMETPSGGWSPAPLLSSAERPQQPWRPPPQIPQQQALPLPVPPEPAPPPSEPFEPFEPVPASPQPELPQPELPVPEPAAGEPTERLVPAERPQAHSRREARRLAQLYPEPRPGVPPPPAQHTVAGSPLAPPNQLPGPHRRQ